MSRFVLRPAGINDAEGIARVHVLSWQETYRGMVPDHFLNSLSIPRQTDQWARSLSDPTDPYHRAIVVKEMGRIVGFANYGIPQQPDEEFDGELYAIYILKSAQGQGNGRMLFAEAARGLLALGSSSMLVWVLKDNPARGFYKQLGGVHVREKNIGIGGEQLEELAYGWRELKTFQAG
jgi:GNAT superfamily N-acetyltransferase